LNVADVHYSQAHNESAQALDFISLLLSQHAPHQAQQTLNPFIKNALPLGILGTDTVQVPQKTDAQKHADSMVALGWKLQSLDSAADALLKSATRLEREMERESNHWEKILAVKEQGWSVCRLPREKHTLGVKYGFSEGVFASKSVNRRKLTISSLCRLSRSRASCPQTRSRWRRES